MRWFERSHALRTHLWLTASTNSVCSLGDIMVSSRAWFAVSCQVAVCRCAHPDHSRQHWVESGPTIIRGLGSGFGIRVRVTVIGGWSHNHGRWGHGRGQ